jgi:predicted SprT family Zn-dependent metalloprotease
MADLSNMIEMVKYVLESNQEARDNDVLLQKVIHYNEYRKKGLEYNLQQRSWVEYLDDITKGTISKAETIRRARRKCQELYPTTRGRKYESRKAKQSEVRDSLRQAEERKTQEEVQTTIWSPRG